MPNWPRPSWISMRSTPTPSLRRPTRSTSNPPRRPFGAVTPLEGGRHLRPGEAGTSVSLEWVWGAPTFLLISMQHPAIELQDVACTFISKDAPGQRYTAVENVSLTVGAGECVSVVGRSEERRAGEEGHTREG